MTVIIFLIILAILILVHEFGHFIVAKKSGIRVDEFGLGFPPKIFAKKFGDTLYTLNMIPFGGFVKIFGEDTHEEVITEEEKKTSFFYKPKWIQALVLVAGVSFNVIFAWLLISLGFIMGIPSPTDYSGFGEVRDAHLFITEVLQNSPAQKAGLRAGDIILSATSDKVSLIEPELTPVTLQNFIENNKSKNVELSYSRGNSPPNKIVIEPNTTTVPGRQAIGIAMDTIGTLKLPIHLAFIEGGRTTYLLVKNTVIGLAKFLGSIFVLKSDFSQVSGPIGIAKVVSEANNLGFVYLLSLIALISINLAVINLLPFPALDGGRLLFVGIEAITRRQISPKFVRNTNAIGFILLIILMLVVTGHDILKLI